MVEIVITMRVLMVFLLLGTCSKVGKSSAATTENIHRGSECKTDNSSTNPTCPSWFIPQVDSGTPTSPSGCKCGDSLHGIVKCNQRTNRSSVLVCHCMSFFETTDQVIVASCLYTCVIWTPYMEVPANSSELSNVMCGSFNREGQLCGKCKSNHSQPVYSYSMQCVQCSDYGTGYRLIKYLAVAFLPLTVFLIIVVTLRIKVASGKLNAFVVLCQLALATSQLRTIATIQKHGMLNLSFGKDLYLLLIVTLYGVWNLDFFRLFYSPFCIHPGMSTLSVMALDYVIAVYPLVLIVVIYVLVELHDRHFRLIVWLWKPFSWCLAHFRRQWDIRTSLLDAFVTFFLLASVKFLNVTMDLLLPVFIYTPYGERLDSAFLYSDGSVEYFGKEHLPYAILAVAVLLVFIILPIVLLLVYPCRCFQRCLNRCRLRCQTLHMVMDVFQGCYKNGTNGTQDCRYFAAVYPILRVVIFILFAVTRSAFFYPSSLTAIIIVIIAITICKPYYYSVHNTLDITFLSVLGLVYSTFYANAGQFRYPHFQDFSLLMVGLTAFIPLVCGTVFMLYWLLCRRKFPQTVIQCTGSLVRRVRAAKRGRTEN